MRNLARNTGARSETKGLRGRGFRFVLWYKKPLLPLASAAPHWRSILMRVIAAVKVSVMVFGPTFILRPFSVPSVSTPAPAADCVKAYFPPGAAMAAMEAAHPPSRAVHMERSTRVVVPANVASWSLLVFIAIFLFGLVA